MRRLDMIEERACVGFHTQVDREIERGGREIAQSLAGKDRACSLCGRREEVERLDAVEHSQ